MGEEKYLYGVEAGYRDCFRIRSTKIIKETPKTIKVTEGIEAYSYSPRVLKNNPNLARSRSEAIKVFIRNAKTRIADLKSEIEDEENDIKEANKLAQG